jgi:hypothetical protein
MREANRALDFGVSLDTTFPFDSPIGVPRDVRAAQPRGLVEPCAGSGRDARDADPAAPGCSSAARG